ncbi:CotH kinase family protein [Sutcliffiella deserti]|uniref:CotH kinase family protein n=1 Tax=Sutcliffiella deserti TaxID=2875501 RepID=UPI001CC0369E|nr:CotH kinase family protein [Sutcliffiella deserti]
MTITKKWSVLVLTGVLFLSIFAVSFTLSPPMQTSNPALEQEEIEKEANIPLQPTNEISDLFLTVDDEDLEHLYTRDRGNDTRIPGRLTVGEHTKEVATELRLRGNSSRALPKKSLSLRFDSEQDFIFGGTHLNLNSMYTDPSMMREKIAFDMFHELGLPASRTQYFNLYINGVYEGLFIQIERVDERLLSYSGLSPRGTLVRDAFRQNQDLENVETRSVFSFDISTIEDPAVFLSETTNYRNNPDWDSFRRLLEWVYRTDAGPDFAKGFAEKVQLNSFMDWLLLHFLIADVDAFSDDYWMYLDHDSNDAKWILLPWDKDLSFGSHYRAATGTANHYFGYESPLQSIQDNLLLQKFLDTPELREKLNERLVYLMKEKFTLQYFERKIENLSAMIKVNEEKLIDVEQFKMNRKNNHGEPGLEEYYQETILDFVELRYQYLAQYLQGFNLEKYTATIDVNDAQPEDTIYFRDGAGWVIGKLEVSSIYNTDKITLSVRQEDASSAIDRIWTIETEGEALKGKLTIYYRNDIGWIGKENWYHEDTPTDGQWDLVLGELQEHGETVPIQTVINPFSNKAASIMEIEFQGKQEFILYHP